MFEVIGSLTSRMSHSHDQLLSSLRVWNSSSTPLDRAAETFDGSQAGFDAVVNNAKIGIRAIHRQIMLQARAWRSG